MPTKIAHPTSIIWLAGCLFWLLAIGSALADDGDPEIEFLLQAVAQSEHQFLRNGEAHGGPEAAAHLRKKYEYRRDDIDGPEAFIAQAASGSWLSGEPYRVQLADGRTELTRDWLTARLAEYRQRPQSPDVRSADAAKSPPGLFAARLSKKRFPKAFIFRRLDARKWRGILPRTGNATKSAFP